MRAHALLLVGTKNHLNNTKYKHNGLGYTDWVKRRKQNVPIHKIAHDFGVTPPTVYSWIQHNKNLS